MGEIVRAEAVSRRKRRLWQQIGLATFIALLAAYGIPYNVEQGPTVFVVVSVGVIAVQVFGIAVSAWELRKLNATARAESTDPHEKPPGD